MCLTHYEFVISDLEDVHFFSKDLTFWHCNILICLFLIEMNGVGETSPTEEFDGNAGKNATALESVTSHSRGCGTVIKAGVGVKGSRGIHHHHHHGHEKKKKNYKLLVDPALKKGCTKVYRYDGVVPGVREVIVKVLSKDSS